MLKVLCIGDSITQGKAENDSNTQLSYRFWLWKSWILPVLMSICVLKMMMIFTNQFNIFDNLMLEYLVTLFKVDLQVKGDIEMLSPSEKYIIESIKQGDQKAFRYLFDNHYTSMCRYAKNIVHTRETAEDIVMDIFVNLWEAGEDLAINSSLQGYLYRSVHNACLNYLTRTHKRFTELSAETIEMIDKSVHPLEMHSIPESFSFSELSLAIEKYMDKLPGECKKIFLLSRFDEISHKEIAAKLGISENTVKVQIYRALKKLKGMLSDYLPAKNGK